MEQQVRNGELDYYAVLGVDPLASQEAIAIAYRRQAARLAGTWWPGAAPRLKLLNAAYLVLGHPARRADYHRRRGLMRQSEARALPQARLEPSPPPPQRAHHSPKAVRSEGGAMELLGLAVVAIITLVAVIVLLRQEKLIDISTPMIEGARVFGLSVRPRPTEAAGLASEEPAIVATSTPAPTVGPTAVPLERQFTGTAVTVEPAEPYLGTIVTVSTRVLRNGEPVAGLPLYLVAHFRTVNERWPAGNGMVRTDAQGRASIPFNIGAATPGYTVSVEVLADVGGKQLAWNGAFTPRRAPQPTRASNEEAPAADEQSPTPTPTP